jgi:proteasome lid subunit RPN8/RPN11
MTLRLPKAMRDEMIAHAKEDLPNECCGVVLGKEGQAEQFRRARNSAASPFRFEIDEKDLLSFHKECWEHDWDFVVIYHSHVASRAYPSPTDVRLAQTAGEPPIETYPGAYYVLVSLQNPDDPDVRAYRIVGGEISEEPIEAF